MQRERKAEREREMSEIDEKSFQEEEDREPRVPFVISSISSILSLEANSHGWRVTIANSRTWSSRSVPRPGRDTIYHVRGILGMPLLKTKGPWSRRKRERERERTELSAGRKNDREREREKLNGERERERERSLGERRGASVYSRGQAMVVGTRGYS